MEELNNEYLGNYREVHELWFNGISNTQTATYDKSQSIKSEYQQYIMNARWYLGGWKTESVSAANMYNYERETDVIKDASDGVTRTTYWDGKVALMYPSDYGFASTDETCLNCLYECNNYISNWLNGYYDEKLLSPNSYNYQYNYYQYRVYVVLKNGRVFNYYYSEAYKNYAVRPTLYLKSNTLFTGGTGTSSNPYTIG